MTDVITDDVIMERHRSGLDAVTAVRVDTTDGRHPKINADDVLEHVPEAVIDSGDGSRWPVIHDNKRLIPELWLAVKELAEIVGRHVARLDMLTMSVAVVTDEVEAVETELGVNPSRTFDDVAARLDAMQTAIGRVDSRLDAIEIPEVTP